MKKAINRWMFFLLALSGCGGGDTGDYSLTIFHTNDRHSHFFGLPNGNFRSDGTADGTQGGAARWLGLVKAARAEDSEVILVDAGDFTMGTLFVAAHHNAADLDFLKLAGYTAASLGNHETDWGEARLAEMIGRAQKPMVPLLASNLHFNPDDASDDSLAALYGEPGEAGKLIFPYWLHQTPRGLKVGLLGLVGLGAAADANVRAAYFSKSLEEMAADTQQLVDRLRQKEGAEVVICLAHLGTEVDGTEITGESVELAKKTRGIDVVVSGHTHTDTGGAHAISSDVDPTWITWVAEASHYGLRLGKMVLSRRGGVRRVESTSLAIDDQLPSDGETTAYIDSLKQDLEQNLLASLPQKPTPGAFLDGTLGQVLTHANFDLVRRENENGNLGYLVADAMRTACGPPMAFASNGGDLRASLPRTQNGGLALPDAFIVTPLGTGPDGKLGYPLAKFHLYLMEIQLLMEATVCDLGLKSDDYMINVSGLRAVIDTSRAGSYTCVRRIILTGDAPEDDSGRVLFDAAAGGFQENSSTLFEVCTSSYIADKMSRFNVYPKDATGQRMPLEQTLVKNGGQEVKLWYVVAGRLAASDPVANDYHEEAVENTFGPYWRRMWDVHRHPCNDHPYCR